MIMNSQDEPEEGAYPRVEALLEYVNETIAFNKENSIYNLPLDKIRSELEDIKRLLAINQ